ncbi:MAG: tetratricopeptide repeat protein, partial [Planctomycetes bacterium]|nr:tetratricopeptide repeat protein [Planctomycetota bacterium]
GRAYVEESKRKKAAGDAKAAVEAADRSARYLALAVQKRAEPRFQDFLWIAATLKELERYPQAIEMLRQTEQRFAAQAGDSIWDARRMIADCYIALQDWKGALDVFKQLVTKEPDVLVYRRELARCYENAGQYDDALREWRDVSQRAKGGTPDWYLSKYHLVANYCHKQNFPRAYEILSLTMDLHPDMGGPESAKKFKDLVQAKFPAEFKQKVAQLEAELAQGAKP